MYLAKGRRLVRFQVSYELLPLRAKEHERRSLFITCLTKLDSRSDFDITCISCSSPGDVYHQQIVKSYALGDKSFFTLKNLI